VLIVEPGAFRTEFGGARMHRARTIDAYRPSTGANRDYIDTMNGAQPDEPAKAARAILQALDAPDAPLRLPLGQDAVDAIRAHHEALLDDLTRWEPVSVDTGVDEVATSLTPPSDARRYAAPVTGARPSAGAAASQKDTGKMLVRLGD
jgi:hypothetical protein